MITHIATAAVYVEDQKKAVEFWINKVGFIVKADFPMMPGANWIEVGPKDAQTNIVLYPKSIMPNWKELKPSIVFICEDVQKEYEAMKNRGVQFKEQPQKMQWGTFVSFSDPDGNEFLLKSQ